MHDGRSIDYPEHVSGCNLFDLDPDCAAILRRLAAPEFAVWQEHLREFGAWVGGPVDRQAHYTDRHARPTLAAFDRDGNQVNEIIYNPAWETASRAVYERGAIGLNYGEGKAPYLITFAMGYLLSQADVSLHCPVTMTGAVAYVLDRFAPETVRQHYLPALTRRDGRALTGGTWATEIHGGSDIGATTTTATAIPGEDGAFRLNGLKWFTSNANGGLALATARPDAGVSGTKGLGLYLVPTHLTDGTPNPMRIRRLKDKLGTCGIATGEIDLTDTWSVEVAPPPQGFKLMMEALEFSRLHNAMSAVGVARRAFLEATAFALHREAFGRGITQYPMVQADIMKILSAQTAGMTLAFNAAHAFDAAAGIGIDDAAHPDRVWLRVLTALAKYWTAEMCVSTASRAIEAIGGNGYVYDRITPRLLRDGQVLSVWEGPANIQALELLRLMEERFGGFTLFSQEMERLLEAGEEANRAAGADIAAPVTRAFAECRESARLMAGAPELAMRHARRFLSLMSDTLAAAYMLDWAGTQAREGNRRMALIARFFIEETLEHPPRRGISSQADWLAPVFEDIIRDRIIS